MSKFLNISEKVVLKFILIVFTTLLIFWAFFHYTEKNIYYSKKFFVSLDMDGKYNTINEYIGDKFSKSKNQNLNNVEIYTREGYNLEFQTWNYKNSVIDIINFRAGYRDKFIFEEDEKFFKNSYLKNDKNQHILNSALNNQLIESVIERTSDEYQSAIIYIGYKNKNQGKTVMKNFEKLISSQVKTSLKKCNKKLDKIKYLDGVYQNFLENNFTPFNSNFVKYFQYSKINEFNCDIYYFIEGKETELPRYNNTMFHMILFLFFSLIILPLIYRINKK
jgi:hypothetical protein